jgi:hypothetical protein
MDELPRYRRELAWDAQLLQPQCAPGSLEEEQALAQLDAARAEEERARQDTPRAARRRLAAYWRRQSTR